MKPSLLFLLAYQIPFTHKQVQVAVTVKKLRVTDPEGIYVAFPFALEGGEVKLDANHPLAGVTLHFDVEVMEVREATSEEIEHGHVHGPGGHEH